MMPPLRRLDWRFLMPSSRTPFEHLVLLGASPPLIEWVRTTGLARRVSSHPEPERCADGLVLLRNARTSIDSAVACLLPEGSLYWEIERDLVSWRRDSPSRVRRRLGRLGLRVAEIYWVRPGFAQPQVYLPLASPRAMKWYWGNVFAATGRRERLLAAAVRAFAPLARLFVRRYSVTALAGRALPGPAGFLGHPGMPPELRARDLRTVLLAAGRDELDRVVLGVFDRGSRDPTAVLKVARAAERNANTENEQRALLAIRPLLDLPMRSTLPRPLGTFGWSDLTVGAETALPGRSLSASAGNRRLRRGEILQSLHLAASWLAEFHSQAQVAQLSWGETESNRWLEPTLIAYETAFGLTASEAQLFSRARERSRALTGRRLPIVWQHNSFGPWNLKFGEHRLRVIDWEGAAVGLPLFDLLYFIQQWGVRALRLRTEADLLRGFRELFCGEPNADPLARAGRAAVDRYLCRLGIEDGFRPLLALLLWAGHALGRFELARTRMTLDANSRSANLYVSLVEAMSGSRETLFGRSGGLVPEGGPGTGRADLRTGVVEPGTPDDMRDQGFPPQRP